MAMETILPIWKDEASKLHTTLGTMNVKLEELRARTVKMIKMRESGYRYKDGYFEFDFNKLLADVRLMIRKLDNFGEEIDAVAKHFTARDVGEKGEWLIKVFEVVCRKINLEADNFSSMFIASKSVFRKSPEEIHWWELEKFITNLLESTKGLLILCRTLNNLLIEAKYPHIIKSLSRAKPAPLPPPAAAPPKTPGIQLKKNGWHKGAP